MSLQRKENNLRRVQARLDKVNKRSKQFQIDFRREGNSRGRFHTRAYIVRGEKTHHGGRGIIHKVANAKYRITGDNPSVTRTIKSWQPKTMKGKLFKANARAVNFAVHDVTQTAVDTALAAETVGLKTSDTAQREVRNKLRKAMNKRRLQAYKQTKRELKFERKQLRTENKYRVKEFRNQKKISKLTRPGLLVLKPATYTAGRMKAYTWQKVVNEDQDNDFLHAIDSAKRRVVEPAAQKVSKPQRLQKKKKQLDRLNDKKSKSNNRLNRQETRLNDKHDSYKKRKKPKPKKKKGAKDTISAQRESSGFAVTENISYDKLLNSGMYEYIGKAEPEKEQSAPVKPEKPVTSSVSVGVLIFAICCEKEWPHHRTGASLSILSAYDVIMTDSDTKQISDTYESYYLAYGLFGIFMKWAKGGYAESAQEIWIKRSPEKCS